MTVSVDQRDPKGGESELARAERKLRLILVVAVIDFALLVPLVAGAILDWGVAPVLGPLHGVGFLYEVYLGARGAGERWWGWWYPAVILVTTGPPGAVFGHGRAQRQARERLAPSPG